jgi:hypothetical protein
MCSSPRRCEVSDDVRVGPVMALARASMICESQVAGAVRRHQLKQCVLSMRPICEKGRKSC